MRNEPVCITNGAGLCEESKKALRNLFGADTVFKSEGEDCSAYAYTLHLPDIEDPKAVKEFVEDIEERIRDGKEALPGYLVAAAIVTLGVVTYGVVSIIQNNRDILQPAEA